MPMKQVAQFWHRMEALMLRADISTDDIETLRPNHYEDVSPTYSLVCRLAYSDCPKVVAQLAIRMVQTELLLCPKPALVLDSPGRAPIHIWAKSELHRADQWVRAADESNNEADNDHEGFLDALLEAWPEAASTTALPDGQLPLHTALFQGKLWKRLERLYLAYPEALCCVHTCTALPPFCLAALRKERRSKATLCARQLVGSKLSGMWYYLSPSTKQELQKVAVQQLDEEQLTTIFEALRAFPSAVVVSNE